MPVYQLQCSCCGFLAKVIRKNPAAASEVACPACSESPMERITVAPTSRVTEVLENGLMTRRVERPADAERLYKERADRDNKEKGFDRKGD